MFGFRQRRIRTQLIFLLTSVIGLFLLAAVVSYLAINQSKQALSEFISKDEPLLLNYTELYANGLQMGQALRNIILDPANPKAFSSWPDGAAGKRPRSATVVITKDDGGKIGS